ncbi:hypothetical protein [Undibacterium sp. Ji49W]|uniref:hypothetical protein n=1 Tax=Undibacterium sp. Ji49W TaxID=3413040 RepID=UPI003BF3A3FE
MPKFNCKCGHDMNLSQGWSNCELALIPEKRIEEIGDLMAGESRLTDDQFFNLIDEVKNTVYRCPMCGRLHLENKNKKNHFESYILES